MAGKEQFVMVGRKMSTNDSVTKLSSCTECSLGYLFKERGFLSSFNLHEAKP